MKNENGVIAIYSRKSKFTGKGESIGNQVDLCREYIRLHYGGPCCTVGAHPRVCGGDLVAVAATRSGVFGAQQWVDPSGAQPLFRLSRSACRRAGDRSRTSADAGAGAGARGGIYRAGAVGLSAGELLCRPSLLAVFRGEHRRIFPAGRERARLVC